MEHMINGIFPIPVYITHRESDLDSIEEKDVNDILKDGIEKKKVQWWGRISTNSYIFDTKLKKIKEFCEQHIETYVEKIINPKEKLNFYITQSWLTYVKPGEGYKRHFHSNSIISGVFYISVGENDKIRFYDAMTLQKEKSKFENLEYNLWNSASWSFKINSVNSFRLPKVPFTKVLNDIEILSVVAFSFGSTL